MDTLEKLNIHSRNKDGVTVIEIYGQLDAHTSPKLEAFIDNTIKNGNLKLIINFKGLDYISSAGLGVFMSFIEDIRDLGGDIKLTEMNDKIYNIFDMLGFPILFEITEKEDVSLDKFNSNEKE
jgi:anti-sigma B factor antagonist